MLKCPFNVVILFKTFFFTSSLILYQKWAKKFFFSKLGRNLQNPLATLIIYKFKSLYSQLHTDFTLCRINV